MAGAAVLGGRRQGGGRLEKTRVHTHGGRGMMVGEDGAAKERVGAREDGAVEELAALAEDCHSAR